jgi:hypothetical protein
MVGRAAGAFVSAENPEAGEPRRLWRPARDAGYAARWRADVRRPRDDLSSSRASFASSPMHVFPQDSLGRREAISLFGWIKYSCFQYVVGFLLTTADRYILVLFDSAHVRRFCEWR